MKCVVRDYPIRACFLVDNLKPSGLMASTTWNYFTLKPVICCSGLAPRFVNSNQWQRHWHALIGYTAEFQQFYFSEGAGGRLHESLIQWAGAATWNLTKVSMRSALPEDSPLVLYAGPIYAPSLSMIIAINVTVSPAVSFAAWCRRQKPLTISNAWCMKISVYYCMVLPVILSKSL